MKQFYILIFLACCASVAACQSSGSFDTLATLPPPGGTENVSNNENITTGDSPSIGLADADVTFVRAQLATDGSWTFTVTIAHPDTGWEDYADGWDVVGPDGIVYKQSQAEPFTRLLLHPHTEEQPFTRAQSGLVIPSDVVEVTVRAHDLVHGYGGRTILVVLTKSGGADFEVIR
jgi:hypothetical protein